jgi:hypothetical protein
VKRNLPVAVGARPDEDDLEPVVDPETRAALVRARGLGSRHDSLLTLIGLGGAATGAVMAAGFDLILSGGVVLAGSLAFMVIGKIVQKLRARRRQLDLGFDEASATRALDAPSEPM